MIEPVILVIGGGMVVATAAVRTARSVALRREEQRRVAQQIQLRSEAAEARRQIRDHARSTIHEMLSVSQRRQW